MKVKNPDLLPYHATVRHAIGRFDELVVEVLTRGATAAITVLAAPWFFRQSVGKEGEAFDRLLFGVSFFAVLIASYVVFATALYADLLRRSVNVATDLESEIFEGDSKCWLTNELDKNFLAGVKQAQFFMLSSRPCFI